MGSEPGVILSLKEILHNLIAAICGNVIAGNFDLVWTTWYPGDYTDINMDWEGLQCHRHERLALTRN